MILFRFADLQTERAGSAVALVVRAWELVAARQPDLDGEALLEALAATGWVDRRTAARIVPTLADFDPFTHFARSLRRLGWRGRRATPAFRRAVVTLFRGLPGAAVTEGRRWLEAYGMPVLAYAEVGWSPGRPPGEELTAAAAAGLAVVVVATSFDDESLRRAPVPLTALTTNRLLGMAAVIRHYRPEPAAVRALLERGGWVTSSDVARLAEARTTGAMGYARTAGVA